MPRGLVAVVRLASVSRMCLGLGVSLSASGECGRRSRRSPYVGPLSRARAGVQGSRTVVALWDGTSLGDLAAAKAVLGAFDVVLVTEWLGHPATRAYLGAARVSVPGNWMETRAPGATTPRIPVSCAPSSSTPSSSYSAATFVALCSQYARENDGGSADSELGFEFVDENDGHFQDLTAPVSDHFCVADGETFAHPTPSPTQLPTAPPTPPPIAPPRNSPGVRPADPRTACARLACRFAAHHRRHRSQSPAVCTAPPQACAA